MDWAIQVPFLVTFKILSLSLLLSILITVCLGVDLLGLIFLGALCASWAWVSVSLSKFRKFSAIVSSNKFSACFSLPSPLGSP